VLHDPSVQVPARLVQQPPGGNCLFVMPAHDAHTAITKLITFTPANTARGLAPNAHGPLLIMGAAVGKPVVEEINKLAKKKAAALWITCGAIQRPTRWNGGLP